jgi:hypothetical protein
MAKRWEYCWAPFTYALRALGPDGPFVPRDPDEATLAEWDRLGEAGWEMVGLTLNVNGTTNGAVFKRKKE